VSVPSVAARRFDGDKVVKIEIDDCLESLAGSAVAQRFGEMVARGGIFVLSATSSATAVRQRCGRVRWRVEGKERSLGGVCAAARRAR
jgi:hypothetical protein